MCKFTLRTYACGHSSVLTDPTKIVLCHLALKFNLKQGKDRAPAACHLIQEDFNYDYSHIDQYEELATLCEACRGTMYNDTDAQLINALKGIVDGLMFQGEEGTAALEKAKDSIITKLRNSWLRDLRSRQDNEKFGPLFVSDLKEARGNLEALYASMVHEAPRCEDFDNLLQYTTQKVELARNKIAAFAAVLIHTNLRETEPGYVTTMFNLCENLQSLCDDDYQPEDDDMYGDEY